MAKAYQTFFCPTCGEEHTTKSKAQTCCDPETGWVCGKCESCFGLKVDADECCTG